MNVLRNVRAGWSYAHEAPGPDAAGPALSSIGDERIAISGVPSAAAVARLAEPGRHPRRQLPPAAGRVVGR